MSFDEIFDLTAGVYIYFFVRYHINHIHHVDQILYNTEESTTSLELPLPPNMSTPVDVFYSSFFDRHLIAEGTLNTTPLRRFV